MVFCEFVLVASLLSRILCFIGFSSSVCCRAISCSLAFFSFSFSCNLWFAVLSPLGHAMFHLLLSLSLSLDSILCPTPHPDFLSLSSFPTCLVFFFLSVNDSFSPFIFLLGSILFHHFFQKFYFASLSLLSLRFVRLACTLVSRFVAHLARGLALNTETASITPAPAPAKSNTSANNNSDVSWNFESLDAEARTRLFGAAPNDTQALARWLRLQTRTSSSTLSTSSSAFSLIDEWLRASEFPTARRRSAARALMIRALEVHSATSYQSISFFLSIIWLKI